MNTGLTLRTIRIKEGVAQIRVGATLLYDLIPEAEEQETLTKAAALVQAVRESNTPEKGKVNRILARNMLTKKTFDMVVLSPGPGRPSQFALNETIALCLEKQIPIFGVCLGLQGIVEYFGGSLDILDYPQHGKSSLIRTDEASSLWDGLP